MKINKIILNNFGSYEGKTIFETKVDKNRNIVLVGGKNGAGKTTLFTAIRTCLYGYKSMGYKNYNSYYIKAITKLLNNNAKLSKPVIASVIMEMELNNEQGTDLYSLKREWRLSESLIENFVVTKNEIVLSEGEIADFEKYLLSLIPPELFNLYFFDGEKIADFFLEEGSSTRIKEAFLTLCNYDTFDIMRKNFKRISDSNKKTASVLTEYIETKENLENIERNVNNLENKIKLCIDAIHNCEALIVTIEKDYREKGGITEEEWNNRLLVLKEEEKKRENYNLSLKRWANDVVPFIMIKKQIYKLKEQIHSENKVLKYINFCEVLNSLEAKKIVIDTNELKDKAFSLFGNEKVPYLNLSLEQNSLIIAQINNIISFEEDKISKYKKAIKSSILKSAKIRKELENSNISTVQEYMKNKAKVFEEKSALLVMQIELEKKLNDNKEKLVEYKNKFLKIQSKLEAELKQASINDISSRAIIMLDKLQKTLYHKQILKVENLFRENIKVLMRKKSFINEVFIDDNFNVHIYRTDNIKTSKIIEILLINQEEQAVSILGIKAIQVLRDLSNSLLLLDIVKFLQTYEKEEVEIPIEIDKSSLSNGEKQIFIMTLYHALISLCKHEIPFIIDTPFARIDTEHRKNISKSFFRKLQGQIFILSTNEEINSTHLKIIEDKIAVTYMLENSDNKKTNIIKNIYFEV